MAGHAHVLPNLHMWLAIWKMSKVSLYLTMNLQYNLYLVISHMKLLKAVSFISDKVGLGPFY